MKKLSISILGVFVLLMLAAGITTYTINNGNFMKVSHSTIGQENFETGKEFYISYDFIWEGTGNPVLLDAEFMQEDGTILKGEDSAFEVTPYASKRGFGTMSEDELNEGDLHPLKGYKVREKFYLALKVRYPDSENDIKTIILTYRNFGLTKSQAIPFDTGVVTD